MLLPVDARATDGFSMQENVARIDPNPYIKCRRSFERRKTKMMLSDTGDVLYLLLHDSQEIFKFSCRAARK